ncbi:unnamed protein product [Echinostoma caproni]|uniref:SCP domain-containing protein n=1 Tax=Echinostoma caproni TaxID=27848 RepID=A0A183A9H8_9TREM|nr:unnamed protein product [Echinostoma caproni]
MFVCSCEDFIVCAISHCNYSYKDKPASVFHLCLSNVCVSQSVIIRCHSFRSSHGCPNISYDAELAKTAQAWASHLAKIGRLQHSEARGYGENLAYRWASNQGSLSGKSHHYGLSDVWCQIYSFALYVDTTYSVYILQSFPLTLTAKQYAFGDCS